MKPGWTETSIGQVCTIVNGGTPKSNVAAYWDGEVYWLTPKDMGKMTGRTFGATPRTITERGLNESSARLVPPGSVIMSTRAPIGHLAINDLPTAFNQGCRGMVPSASLDHVYLYHYLSANVEALNNLGTGATFKELSASALKEFSIPLPPLEEQKRIVSVLDEAFEGLARARANAEANLADARELWAVLLNDAFELGPDPLSEYALKELAATDCTLSYGIVQPGDDEEGGLPIVRPVDLGTDLVTLRGLKRIAPERAKGYSRTTLQGGELLLCVRGSTGVTSIAAPELAGANVTRGIVPIRFSAERIDPRFAAYQFGAPAVQGQIASKTYGAALMQINIGDLKNVKLKAPSIERQLKVVAQLDLMQADVSSAEAAVQRSIADIQTLRQSLLQKAFSGGLT